MKKFTHLSSNKTALKPISTELTIYKFPSLNMYYSLTHACNSCSYIYQYYFIY